MLLANVLYFVLAASGLITTLSSSSTVFYLLKIFGSVYLIFIGITIFRLPRIQQKIKNSLEKGNSAVVKGFIIHASNPKVLLLFSAIVPMFIEPNVTLVSQLALMGISVLIIQAGILFTYACFSKKMIGFKSYYMLFINRVGGGFL
ncbi:MAG: LysE family transporter [Colwellia sp.]|nr:LysE family transporter [Colwellia sp.]